jgi:hypothetical protein
MLKPVERIDQGDVDAPGWLRGATGGGDARARCSTSLTRVDPDSADRLLVLVPPPIGHGEEPCVDQAEPSQQEDRAEDSFQPGESQGDAKRDKHHTCNGQATGRSTALLRKWSRRTTRPAG